NRDVALKVLDPEAAADGNLRRMFVKEARALAQLSHPNIVAVYDVGEVDDSPFIVMEYLPGGSMKQRIEQAGPLKTGDAVRIAIEVANGLAFAHSKGIVHADLKPSNILFDANDAAKICDFGTALAPRELDSVALKALARQPNLRYQKASDFATALQRLENVDQELATTRVMADPLEDFVPKTEQSPVVALLSTYGQPLRGAFFSLCAA